MWFELGVRQVADDEPLEDRRTRKRRSLFDQLCVACHWTKRELAAQPVAVVLDRLASACGQNPKLIDTGQLPGWIAEYVTDDESRQRS
jgi:hypothetical protein